MIGKSNWLIRGVSLNTIGEEVKNPKRTLPLSMILTLIIVASVFCSITLVVSLMVPFHLVDPSAPIPSAFAYVEFDTVKYVAMVGTITTISARWVLYEKYYKLSKIDWWYVSIVTNVASLYAGMYAVSRVFFPFCLLYWPFVFLKE